MQRRPGECVAGCIVSLISRKLLVVAGVSTACDDIQKQQHHHAAAGKKEAPDEVHNSRLGKQVVGARVRTYKYCTYDIVGELLVLAAAAAHNGASHNAQDCREQTKVTAGDAADDDANRPPDAGPDAEIVRRRALGAQISRSGAP